MQIIQDIPDIYAGCMYYLIHIFKKYVIAGDKLPRFNGAFSI